MTQPAEKSTAQKSAQTVKTPGPVAKKSAAATETETVNRGFHVVKKGDTLYSIAWNYALDFRDVAGWNRVQAPYLIYPGQVLRLKPAPEASPAVAQPGPVMDESATAAKPGVPGPVKSKTTEKPVTAVRKKTAGAKKTQTIKKSVQTRNVSWRWPVRGKIIKSSTPTSKKGVDIAGRLGQDIKAAAQGDVVYSGSGLLGYGRLIIIKHNETYLSAYAYNSELLVKEGDSVTSGQIIARMGTANTGQAQLHFEIRKNGKSVNPLKLLPRS
ncbi:MAG: peptidoglycan DD-metalloendopeptidase family protein [Thiotrichales bacterium]|nr:peptidoglycan DD-metalloendopeptidase family protein [Thiotrichales bacterium]